MCIALMLSIEIDRLVGRQKADFLDLMLVEKSATFPVYAPETKSSQGSGTTTATPRRDFDHAMAEMAVIRRLGKASPEGCPSRHYSGSSACLLICRTSSPKMTRRMLRLSSNGTIRSGSKASLSELTNPSGALFVASRST
jgi:hypothetical protein